MYFYHHLSVYVPVYVTTIGLRNIVAVGCALARWALAFRFGAHLKCVQLVESGVLALCALHGRDSQRRHCKQVASVFLI